MAGSIKTGPVTKEYEKGYDRAFKRESRVVGRVEEPHECEHCGRIMKYADQSCACTARRPLS